MCGPWQELNCKTAILIGRFFACLKLYLYCARSQVYLCAVLNILDRGQKLALLQKQGESFQICQLHVSDASRTFARDLTMQVINYGFWAPWTRVQRIHCLLISITPHFLQRLVITIFPERRAWRHCSRRRLSDAPNLGPRFGAPYNIKHYSYQCNGNIFMKLTHMVY